MYSRTNDSYDIVSDKQSGVRYYMNFFVFFGGERQKKKEAAYLITLWPSWYCRARLVNTSQAVICSQPDFSRAPGKEKHWRETHQQKLGFQQSFESEKKASADQLGAPLLPLPAAAAAWLPQMADTSRSSDRIAATPVCQPLPIQDDITFPFKLFH